MPAEAPLACAACHVAAALSIDADWNHTIHCPKCGQSASWADAFREAEACETAYLLGSQSNEGTLRERFVTIRMLCVLCAKRSPPRAIDP